MAGRFNSKNFLIRFIFTFGVILAAYNPSGYSYVDWVMDGNDGNIAVKTLAGICLTVTIGFVIGMAQKVLRRSGMLLGALFFLSAYWTLDTYGFLPKQTAILVILAEGAMAATLAAGLSLAILREQVSGVSTKLKM
jgi:uncharacterized membrane protein (Fun14 family)